MFITLYLMAIVTKYVLELLAIARSLLFLARCSTAVLLHYDYFNIHCLRVNWDFNQDEGSGQSCPLVLVSAVLHESLP